MRRTTGRERQRRVVSYWRTGISGAELTPGAFLDWSRACDLRNGGLKVGYEQWSNETHLGVREIVVNTAARVREVDRVLDGF